MKHKQKGLLRKSLPIVPLFLSLAAAAQNSPYSRYGLGDEVPNTNIMTRGMGGITAGVTDIFSVNFSNPASYSRFQTSIEPRSRQLSSGRVVLDVGLNIENRGIREPNTPNRFSSTNAYFSHVQAGIPLRPNWGLSFGIRQLTRIDYRILRTELLKDPNTGNPIDSALTEFTGSGGSFLPNIGTGFSIGNLSAGASAGYLFGRKELNTRRAITGEHPYATSNHGVRSSFGDLFFNAGLQYHIRLKSATSLRLGAAGNWTQSLSASQNSIRETFVRTPNGEDIPIDTVESRTDLKGEVVYPASYTVGFVVDRSATRERRGLIFGLDLIQKQWDDYRFFGAADAVSNSWEVRAGAQIAPSLDPTRGRFSQQIVYRAGFFMGRDYISVDGALPRVGGSLGFGLPMRLSRMSPGQHTVINLALEYASRGNNNNLVKENTFRFSVGLSLTDLWFGKRRYE